MSVLAELTDEHLWCRSERHLWLWERDTQVVSEKGQVVSFVRISTCDRCGSTRDREISTVTFTVVKRHMNYADGYLVHGVGRVTSAMVYEEQWNRAQSMIKRGARHA